MLDAVPKQAHGLKQPSPPVQLTETVDWGCLGFFLSQGLIFFGGRVFFLGAAIKQGQKERHDFSGGNPPPPLPPGNQDGYFLGGRPLASQHFGYFSLGHPLDRK